MYALYFVCRAVKAQIAYEMDSDVMEVSLLESKSESKAEFVRYAISDVKFSLSRNVLTEVGTVSSKYKTFTTKIEERKPVNLGHRKDDSPWPSALTLVCRESA